MYEVTIAKVMFLEIEAKSEQEAIAKASRLDLEDIEEQIEPEWDIVDAEEITYDD